MAVAGPRGARLDAAGGSLPGPGPARRNEDAWYAGNRLFAVVDGVGGRPDAHDAAALVVEALAAGCVGSPSVEGLRAALERVHQGLRARSAQRGHPRAMAAVCTAAWIDPERERLVVGHVGDTRLFLLDVGGVGEQVTPDDIDEDWDGGARASRRVRAALGAEDGPAPVTLEEVSLPVGAVLVLVTDGVSEILPRGELGALVCDTRGSEGTVAAVLERVAAAHARTGAGDDATVVVVRFAAAEPPGDSAAGPPRGRSEGGVGGWVLVLLAVAAAAVALLLGGSP